MKKKQAKQTQPLHAGKPAVANPSADKATADPGLTQTGSLPPAHKLPACDPNCVDVTGKVPEDIRIDPDITEGHPGYEESGDSEIIPPERLAGGKGTGGKDKSV